MSDDPETLRQIAELASDDRPLLVLDVDDVVLEFVRPFPRYLSARGFELRFESFRLHGNVVNTASGERAPDETVSQLIDEFFRNQHDWQTMTDGAAEALALFGDAVEIVLLTAMPHRHREARRRLLDTLGLTYPLLTTERAKGPAIRLLRGARARPVAFVDDMHRNLISVQEAVPDAHLFHLMADNSLRALLPPTPQGVHHVKDWPDAAPKIASALGI